MKSEMEDGAAKEIRFEGLVERQSRFVFRVAYAVLRNPDSAEDVVQETFLKLYRNGGWEDLREERAFLARVVWRMAVDRLPRRDREHELMDMRSSEESPEERAIRADWIGSVHRMLNALPRELREVMALSGIEGMNSSEIASAMGVPAGTVRTRMMRAREILKRKLAVLTRNPCEK